MLGICDHWSIDHPGLRFKSPVLHGARPRFRFKSLKLLNFDFNADMDSAFNSYADPDPGPAPKNNADPCGSGYESATLFGGHIDRSGF